MDGQKLEGVLLELFVPNIPKRGKFSTRVTRLSNGRLKRTEQRIKIE
jgi:hypothetical protein